MKTKLLSIFSFFLFLGIGFLGIEMYINSGEIVSRFLRKYDPELGLKNRTDHDYIYFKESFFVSKTDKFGRFSGGKEYEQKKRDGVYRIAIIGDSYMEGIDVFDRFHFRNFLEDDLNAAQDKEVEVLGFGRGNFSIGISFYYMQHKVLKFEPDLILYCVENRDYNLHQSPYFPCYKMENGELVLNNDWKETGTAKMSMRLDTTPILNHYADLTLPRLFKKAQLHSNQFKSKALGKFYPLVTGDPIPTYDSKFSNKPDVLQEGPKRVIDAIHKLDMERDDFKVQFIARPPNSPWPTTEIQDYIKSVHGDVYDLAPPMSKLEGNGRYWKATDITGGHWNHLGHECAGHYLAKRILADGHIQ